MKRNFLTPVVMYDKMFLNDNVYVYRWLKDEKWFGKRENGMMKKGVKGKNNSEFRK